MANSKLPCAMAIADDDSEAATKIKKLESGIKSIETVSTGATLSSNTNEGCLLYILARLSKSICTSQKGATSFDLCLECDGGDEEGHGKSFSAALVRPKSLEQFMALLNLFIMVSHASEHVRASMRLEHAQVEARDQSRISGARE